MRVDSSGDGGELTQFQATFPLDTLADSRCNKSKGQQLWPMSQVWPAACLVKFFFFLKATFISLFIYILSMDGFVL